MEEKKRDPGERYADIKIERPVIESVPPKSHGYETCTAFVTCSSCGKRVSNDFTGALYIRAYVECPECIMMPEPKNPGWWKKLNWKNIFKIEKWEK